MSACTAARNNACAHYGHRAAVGAPFPVRRPCTRKKENVMVKFILKRIGTMIIAMFMIILMGWRGTAAINRPLSLFSFGSI